MRAVIEDNQWIWMRHLTDAEEDILWAEFSVCKPNVYIDPTQLGNWDGIFRKYNRAKKRVARPFLSMLRAICRKHGLPLSVVDKRPKPDYIPLKPEEITDDFLPGITLETHQKHSIQQACKIECGIFDIPTGGGKCICFESKVYIEGFGEIEIGTLFDGFRDEEYRPVDGLRVKYPGGVIDVVALYKTNKRPIMRLELESGHWLRGVPEHRVYTRRGWIMLKDITADDEVAINGQINGIP